MKMCTFAIASPSLSQHTHAHTHTRAWTHTQTHKPRNTQTQIYYAFVLSSVQNSSVLSTVRWQMFIVGGGANLHTWALLTMPPRWPSESQPQLRGLEEEVLDFAGLKWTGLICLRFLAPLLSLLGGAGWWSTGKSLPSASASVPETSRSPSQSVLSVSMSCMHVSNLGARLLFQGVLAKPACLGWG